MLVCYSYNAKHVHITFTFQIWNSFINMGKISADTCNHNICPVSSVREAFTSAFKHNLTYNIYAMAKNQFHIKYELKW